MMAMDLPSKTVKPHRLILLEVALVMYLLTATEKELRCAPNNATIQIPTPVKNNLHLKQHKSKEFVNSLSIPQYVGSIGAHDPF